MEKGKEEEGEAFVIPENRSLVASVERGGDGTERKGGGWRLCPSLLSSSSLIP